MRRLIIEAAIAAGCLAAGHASGSGGDISLKILRASKAEGVWARPYVAPAMNFKLLHGEPPEGAVEGCVPTREVRTRADHTDTIIVLDCKNGVVLELQNVDFEN
jgi:hypothetical protein